MLISVAKKNFSIAIVLPHVLMCQKRQISLPGGYKTALGYKTACVVYEKIRKRRRNLFFARLGVLNWRHNRSQSPGFGLAVLYPTGSEIWCFWYIKTRERKIAMEKPFLLYLSVHWGDFIEQIKKICHIHFNWLLTFTPRSLSFSIYTSLKTIIVTCGINCMDASFKLSMGF